VSALPVLSGVCDTSVRELCANALWCRLLFIEAAAEVQSTQPGVGRVGRLGLGCWSRSAYRRRRVRSKNHRPRLTAKQYMHEAWMREMCNAGLMIGGGRLVPGDDDDDDERCVMAT